MASTSSTSLPRYRFVKCPKCATVLVEFAEVPVYRCGQCDTVLQAKTRVVLDSRSAGNENVLGNSLNREAQSFVGQGVQSAASCGHHVSDSVNASNSKGKEMSLDDSKTEIGERRSGSSNHSGRFSHERSEMSNGKRIQDEQGELSLDGEVENLDISSSSSKVCQCSESNNENGALEVENVNLATGSPKSYDGNASSSDRSREDGIPHKYLLKSRRTFRRKKSADLSEKEPQAQCRVLIEFPDEPSDENFDSETKRSFDSGRDESQHISQVDPRERDTTFGSEDFHSLQNLNLSESYQGSLNSLPVDPFENSKLSTKIDGLEPEHMKILRKVDELKEELSEYLVRRVEDKGTSQLKSQFSRVPLSLHAHPKTTCNNVDASINLPRYSPEVRLADKGAKKFPPKEKKVAAIKSYCRPVCSGAPFVICYKCWKLLQLPADFLLTQKHLHKLRCGSCSHVLVFSFRPRDPTGPTTPTEVQHPPSEVENLNDHAGWDPVSYSDDCKVSLSSDAETVHNVSMTSSWRDNPRLHRLMGYPSATLLLHQADGFDEGYQSGEPSTPHFHRSLDDDTIYRVDDDSEIQEEEEEGPSERLKTRRRAAAIQGLMKKGVRELSHGFQSMKLKIRSNG